MRERSNNPLPMTLFAHIDVDELGPLLKLVQQSHCIRRHYELFNWLQDDIQHFLPHGILIAAWGDLSTNAFCYDIVSPLAGVRTDEFDEIPVRSFLLSLFSRWQEAQYQPFALKAKSGFAPKEIINPVTRKAMQDMRSALVDGIRDQRGRHHCMYVMMGPPELSNPRSREALRFLLPHIDITFRQINHLPDQYLENGATPAPQEKAAVEEAFPFSDTTWHTLSDREKEIMNWIRNGKTNSEVGQILDISIFTVKNHLQRIFKKLNVSNRAQAVAKTEAPQPHDHK